MLGGACSSAANPSSVRVHLSVQVLFDACAVMSLDRAACVFAMHARWSHALHISRVVIRIGCTCGMRCTALHNLNVRHPRAFDMMCTKHVMARALCTAPVAWRATGDSVDAYRTVATSQLSEKSTRVVARKLINRVSRAQRGTQRPKR